MKKTIFLFTTTLLLGGSLSAQTNDHDHYVQEGIKLYDKGNYDAAIEQYNKALAIDKKSPAANYEMANTYFHLKNYEKAIDYSEKVISANKKYVDQAYIIKGSAQDMAGKPKDAIKTYKKAIKDFPDNHLLYFNLGYTAYKIKETKEAMQALQKAVIIKPSHASSHLLLAYVMDEQGSRVRSMLCLYNFLLLEPKGNRAEAAYKMLNALLRKGVRKESGNTISITLPSDSKEPDDFQAAELMISLLEASKTAEKNEDKSDEQFFADNTKAFFDLLGSLRKDEKGFWWSYYIDFFYDMSNSGKTEAFSYYISQVSGKEPVTQWLDANKEKIDALSRWYKGYERKGL